MKQTNRQKMISFSKPLRQIVTMLLVCALVVSGIWFIRAEVAQIMQTNPWLNAFIAAVFLFGVITCFWQVFILIQSVNWIEGFVNETPGNSEARPPRLLAPLASLLRSRESKMAISSSSAHSILESVATRIDEARDITRYLTNLLIFLGLLGTFYGLATTIPAIVDTIRSLAPQAGESGLDVFTKLMGGLQKQLGGMSTAFSSSLLGLAGSLVVGLLELFASHGQNRFYRELEEWVSSITRLGLASTDGDAGADQSLMLQVLDNVTGQIEVLQTLYMQAEEGRDSSNEKLIELAQIMRKMARDMEGGRAQIEALNRIAEGQDRVLAALTGTETQPGYADAESRMRLRSIDVQLLRILEEISAGRQESIADLRSDLTALTTAIRAMSRGTVGRG
ncbi:MAG: biopolymer transporter ExbB [Alphaproteobacteria bacterium]